MRAIHRAWSLAPVIAGTLCVASCGARTALRLPDAVAPDAIAPETGVPAAGCRDAPWVICTWAGLPGELGFNDDGHDRRASRFYWPTDLAFTPDGMALVLDWNNHRIRRVNADQTLETIVGTVIPGDGDPLMSDLMPPGALGTEAALNHPTDVLIEPDGRVLIAAWHNAKIRRWDPATGREVVLVGRTPAFAGDGRPLDESTRLNHPVKLARDASGNVYVLDQLNARVRRIAPDQTITTVAGTGAFGFSGDGGPPRAATFEFQRGETPEPEGALALAPDGRLFVADSSNHRVRVIDFARDRIDTFAGTGVRGYGGDGGPAAAAMIASPRDLAIGPDGDLYVADTGNHCVRAIDLATSTIRTVAGTCGRFGFDGDGRDARGALMQRPFGIAFDPAGNLYIADTYNSCIRRVARGW